MAQREYMRSQTITRGAEIDAGLQAYMSKVYALMVGAMILTGLVAYVVGGDYLAVKQAAEAGIPLDQAKTLILSADMVVAMLSSPIKWILMLAPLAVVFGFGAMINRMSAGTAQMVFWAFGALSWACRLRGSSPSFTADLDRADLLRDRHQPLVLMSIYGYTTKKDLSGWGRFLMMGVIGLIVASLLNIFLFESSALHWAISLLGVLIFAGLTAYDTQNIKNTYLMMRQTPGGEAYLEKGAVMGALSLYLNFLNMFMFLLQFMGASQE